MKKFYVNYLTDDALDNDGGGYLYIGDTEICLKLSKLSLSVDTSDKIIKIADVKSVVKRDELLGLRKTLIITDKNDYRMRLVSWKRNDIIAAIEDRKASIENEMKNKTKFNSATTEQLMNIKKLLDSGMISQEEFDAEKQKILNS